MACLDPSTERHRPTAGRLRGLAVALALLACAASAAAHPPPRINSREIVRISGWFGTPPKGSTVVRDVTLTVQGKTRPFHAVDWQLFALVSDQSETVAPMPDALTLQGTREVMARLAGARGEQRVSILAEHRPGSAEVFILALDLCPEK